MAFPHSRLFLWFVAVLMALVLTNSASAQQGLMLSGAGPVNRSMGGAAVAAPIDATGALFWNPASITGLQRPEMEFGIELVYPQPTLESRIGPLSGSTSSDGGVYVVPSLGFVYQQPDSSWTVGLGVYGTGGFGVNYPQDRSNPLLLPAPPRGPGLGPLYSRLQILEIAPTLACQLTDHLSIGFAPTLSLADLWVDPALFAGPNLVNGAPIYPTGTHGRTFWGGGFQAGLYYTTDSCWNFGASVKSPQWFETFRWHTVDGAGLARTIKFPFELPMILSVGGAYTGIERVTLAADVRYFDYHNASGFRATGFDQTGALRGLGWDSILAVAVGVQYQWTEDLALRAGYTWNENPIPGGNTIYNVLSPTILQNTIAIGASYRITDSWEVSLAYLHAFQNSVQGPITTAEENYPRISVRSRVESDDVLVGLTVRF